jgi:hypothetical protein
MSTPQPHRPFTALARFSRRAALRSALAMPGVALGVSVSMASPSRDDRIPPMTLELQLGPHTLRLQLDDHPTARDLLNLLPLDLHLEDYADTEKIASLPRRLSTAAAPAGYTPAAGDLAYYAPWGNLAFFHKPFAHSAGLIRLGRLETGVDLLAQPGKRNARLRRSAG